MHIHPYLSKKGIQVAECIGILLAVFFLWFFFTAGPSRTDVAIADFSLYEDGRTMYLDAGITTSAGYLKSVEVKEANENLFLTFHATHGLNNAIGSHSRFSINLPETCRGIWLYDGADQYHQVLEKDAGGTWIRTEQK